MSSKYKVGDRVKIREGLEDGELYGNVVFVYGMKKHKEVTISRIESNDEGIIYVSDNNYYYTDEMIEGLVDSKYKVGDKLKIKEDLVIGEYYGCNSFVENMKQYTEITIKKVCHDRPTIEYLSEENNYYYTAEMIEGLVSNNKYKIRDRVKIKDDLVVGERYGGTMFVSGMKAHKEITIRSLETRIDGKCVYVSEEDRYCYTDEMIEGLIKEEEGDVDMETRLNIIEAGNMPVGTKFRLFDEEGNEETSIVEVIESKNSCANKFLAWDGNYNTPLTLADTNINCYFEVISEYNEEWEEVDFMTAVKHHYDNGTIRWGKGDNEVIYDGDESTYFEPLSGVKQDGISSYKIMYGSWYIKVE